VAGSTHEIWGFYTLVRDWNDLRIFLVDRMVNLRPSGATRGK
jgi:hypothetical protein